MTFTLWIIGLAASAGIIYITIDNLRTGVSSMRFSSVRRDEHPFLYWLNIITHLTLLGAIWIAIILTQFR